jgi:hypothetical protein
MNRRLRVSSLAAASLFCAVAMVRGSGGDQYAPRPAAGVPTFARDVAPILMKNCASCHRPGEIAPMSLLTYEEARPWARAIRDAVVDGMMPPWHADAPHGTFLNERSLTAAERETIVRWASCLPAVPDTTWSCRRRRSWSVRSMPACS